MDNSDQAQVLAAVRGRLTVGARIERGETDPVFKLPAQGERCTVAFATAGGVMMQSDEGTPHWIPIGCDLTRARVDVEETADGFRVGMNGRWIAYPWL